MKASLPCAPPGVLGPGAALLTSAASHVAPRRTVPLRMFDRLRRTVRAFRESRTLRADPVRFARDLGVRVGDDCRLLGVTRETFGSEPYLIKLGDHVTVTAGVHFVTHDGGVWVFRREFPDLDVFGRIEVGNNVFIGIGSIILPGVRIGDDCVIGAGSVVKHDIPSRTVAAGVPARPIRTLAEYRDRTLPHASHIRDLPETEKRARLEKHFWKD
jgi:acetyltransferase-like isoleucine patch superfamily enzyme